MWPAPARHLAASARQHPSDQRGEVARSRRSPPPITRSATAPPVATAGTGQIALPARPFTPPRTPTRRDAGLRYSQAVAGRFDHPRRPGRTLALVPAARRSARDSVQIVDCRNHPARTDAERRLWSGTGRDSVSRWSSFGATSLTTSPRTRPPADRRLSGYTCHAASRR